MELDEEQLGLRYQVGVFYFFLNVFFWSLSWSVLSCIQIYANLHSLFLQSFCDPRLNFEQCLC